MNSNLKIAAALGGVSVILGAFGAHALKETLSADTLNSFETGVRYQMYHVILLLFVNIYNGFTKVQKNRISYCLIAGIIFFSGSIYAIAFGVSARNIWFITPLGGLFFIIGWFLMLGAFFKEKN